jgi:hypothetical protein
VISSSGVAVLTYSASSTDHALNERRALAAKHGAAPEIYFVHEEVAMKRSVAVACGALVITMLLVAGASSVTAADADTRLGTWKLNVAKSTYDPGPAPKSSMRTYAPFGGDGVTFTSDTVNADGSRTKTSFSLHYDGKDYPEADSANRYDTISSKRIDAYTTEITQKKAGKVVQTGRIVVSKDGKMLTSTLKGTNAKGPYTNVQVFDRQ